MAKVHHETLAKQAENYLRNFAQHMIRGGATTIGNNLLKIADWLIILILELQERTEQMGQVQVVVAQLEAKIRGQQGQITDLQTQLTTAQQAPTLDAADTQELQRALDLLNGPGTPPADTTGGAAGTDTLAGGAGPTGANPVGGRTV